MTTDKAEEASPNQSAILQRRLLDREEWKDYWKAREFDSRGTWYPRARYYVHKAFDAPITWFRETIVEPRNDKGRLPYYQRQMARVPEIDECGVNDQGCYFEANEQFRLDKMVDGFILTVLRDRVDKCNTYHHPFNKPCINVIEQMEEAEYNYFVKYSELGSEADVRDAYMKQKHRLIWERDHPEVMAARKAAYDEHKQKVAAGEQDYAFWKKGLYHQDKKNQEPPYELQISKPTAEGDKPLSKDWQYYKKVAEDPEFDKKQGFEAHVPFW